MNGFNTGTATTGTPAVSWSGGSFGVGAPVVRAIRQSN